MREEAVVEAPARGERGGRRRAVVLIVAAAAVVAVVALGREAARHLQDFALWVDGLGALGPLVFIGGYALAAVAFVPGSLLTLAAGALFGLTGALYVLVAATLGASGAFLLARYGARAAVERRLMGNERFAAIDRAIGTQGFKIVLLLRLSPVFPFNMLNYALGLTRVRFTDFFLASVGMLPGTLLYVYYGKLGGDVASLASGVPQPRGPGYYATLVLGLAATLVVTTIVTRIARRALKEATDVRP